MVFLDPAAPRPADLLDHADRRVTDLALWTYATTVYLPWDVLASPRGAWQLLKLNATFIALVLDSAPPGVALTVRDVERATNQYLHRLLSLWPRDKVVWGQARVASWLIMRWAGWKLRRLGRDRR
jgi:hypothetical protein